MQTRIKKNFDILSKLEKSTVIPFVSGGDPDVKQSTEILKSFAKNGARIIECGFNWNAPVSDGDPIDRKSTRLNSSHVVISYAVFCLKKKRKEKKR